MILLCYSRPIQERILSAPQNLSLVAKISFWGAFTMEGIQND